MECNSADSAGAGLTDALNACRAEKGKGKRERWRELMRGLDQSDKIWASAGNSAKRARSVSRREAGADGE